MAGSVPSAVGAVGYEPHIVGSKVTCLRP